MTRLHSLTLPSEPREVIRTAKETGVQPDFDRQFGGAETSVERSGSVAIHPGYDAALGRIVRPRPEPVHPQPVRRPRREPYAYD